VVDSAVPYKYEDQGTASIRSYWEPGMKEITNGILFGEGVKNVNHNPNSLVM
jgi:hypothetical protein